MTDPGRTLIGPRADPEQRQKRESGFAHALINDHGDIGVGWDACLAFERVLLTLLPLLPPHCC